VKGKGKNAIVRPLFFAVVFLGYTPSPARKGGTMVAMCVVGGRGGGEVGAK
jgi:hypothetical protein